jgi:hypothetical protein
MLVFSLFELQEPLSQNATISKIADQLVTIAVHAIKAPILLVGTRKDELKGVVGGAEGQAAALDVLSELLHSRLSQCPAYMEGSVADGNLCFFAVENSRGFTGDETIRRLAVAIDKATDSLPTMQQLVPAGWLKVFDELRSRLAATSSAQQWLPLAEVQSIGSQCGMPHRKGVPLEVEVHAMLTFFHSLCAVIWFDEPGLRDLVVLDPQWLIDGLSCIVRNFTLHPMPCDRSCERQYEAEWTALKHDAKLSMTLLPLLWGDTRFASHKDLLLRLAVRFGLAVPIRGKEELIVSPLLVFGVQKPPSVPVPADAVHFWLHFAHQPPQPNTYNSASSTPAPPKSLWTDEDLKHGFLPVGAFHQLCVAAVGWCFHTVVSGLLNDKPK